MGKVTQTPHEVTESVRRCGHCGTEAVMQIVCVGEHRVSEEVEWVGDVFSATKYEVLLCPSCNAPNVYASSFDSEHTYGTDPERDDFLVVETTLLYPATKTGYFSTLPDNVQKAYAIAARLRRIEPSASVVFSRKSIEAICTDQGVIGDNLRKKIDTLASTNVIPPLLKDAAHSVRLIGNEGAHELEVDISRDEAEALLALCEAIIGYVYEAPRLLKKVQERVNKSQGITTQGGHEDAG